MPLIPLHDANPRLYIRAHYATIALIAINTLIFVSQLGIGDGQRFDAVAGYAVVPARFFDGLEVPAGIAGVSFDPVIRTRSLKTTVPSCGSSCAPVCFSSSRTPSPRHVIGYRPNSIAASNIATTLATGTPAWMLCTGLNTNPPPGARSRILRRTSARTSSGVP